MISVPIFYTRPGMLLLTTYPKFTCRSFTHFKLFQIYSNCSIQDHLKTTLKFENCLSTKVRFFIRIPEQLSLHFYDFSTIYYVIYKIQVFNPRFVDVVLQKGPPIENQDYNRVPGGGARLAGGEGWPDSGERAARVGFGLTLS
jgi:hypothetical protein